MRAIPPPERDCTARSSVKGSFASPRRELRAGLGARFMRKKGKLQTAGISTRTRLHKGAVSQHYGLSKG